MNDEYKYVQRAGRYLMTISLDGCRLSLPGNPAGTVVMIVPCDTGFGDKWDYCWHAYDPRTGEGRYFDSIDLALESITGRGLRAWTCHAG